ncbi:MAG: ComEA family DNA-binding protein [Planctomycetota bacterium]|jgi:competence protein ComEA
MRADPRPTPGTWLVIGLLAVGIGVSAWLRVTRVTTPAAGADWPDMRVDVNAAAAVELEVLPGIGPRLAERITADRAVHGPFATVDDLARVPGVGERLVDGIRPYAVAGSEGDR